MVQREEEIGPDGYPMMGEYEFGESMNDEQIAKIPSLVRLENLHENLMIILDRTK